MGTRLFIGNVSYDTTEETLRSLFEDRGYVVTDVVIVTDRETGRSRGFGFIELGGDKEAERAKETLDGTELEGRRLTIREAYERTPRRPERRFQKVEVERVGRPVVLDQDAWPIQSTWPSLDEVGRHDKDPRGGRSRRHSGSRRERRSRNDWHDEEGW